VKCRLSVLGRDAPYRTRPPLPVGPDAVTVTTTDPTPVEGTRPTPATRTVIVRPACSAPWWLPPAPVRVSTTRDCVDRATYVPGTPLVAAPAGTSATASAEVPASAADRTRRARRRTELLKIANARSR